MVEVEAGWFTDPHGSGRRRYWDGEVWTEHLEPIAAPVPAPEPAPMRSAPAARVSHAIEGSDPSRLAALPTWAKVLARAALVLVVIVPISTPLAQHLIDTIGLNAEAFTSAAEDGPEMVGTFQDLLRAAILVTFWACVFGGIGLLLRLGWVRLAGNREHIRIAWRRWGVRRFDGTVTSASKLSTTTVTGHVSGSSSGQVTGSVGSTTTRQDDFTVADPFGATRGFRAIDFNLNVAPGHDVSVVQFVRGRRATLISVTNRTSGHLFTDRRQIARMTRGMWGTSFLLLVGLIGSFGVTQLGNSDLSPAVTFACLGGLVASFAAQRVSRRRVRKAIEAITA